MGDCIYGHFMVNSSVENSIVLICVIVGVKIENCEC